MGSMDYYVTTKQDPDTSPQGIFINAIGWDYCACLMFLDTRQRMDIGKSVSEKDGSPVMFRLPALKPAVVASVLAVELYLKSLLGCEKTSYKKIHELEGLFKAVSQAAQKRIGELFDQMFLRDPDLVEWKEAARGTPEEAMFTLDATIAICNTAFIEWRYYHEGIPTAERPNIAPLKDALRLYLVELNPTWSEVLEHFHKT